MAFGKMRQHGSGDVPELGAIFMANRATKKLCFSWKTFGLPYSKANFVKQVKAGMFLFLFEHESRKLHGVYQACSDGEMDFSSDAFSSAGRQYPAQVKFKVLWYCKPLSEDEFRPAIKDNYFAEYKFKFGLSRNQVRELLWLFSSRILRDELPRKEILPVDPYSIRGATRSPSIDDVGERFTDGVLFQNVLENANALEQNMNLEKFSMPNIEVRVRDKVIEDAVLPLNNCRRDLPLQDRVIQLRNVMDYGCKQSNDYELNSGVPYVSSHEGYDPDAPLLYDMTATLQQQRFHEHGRLMDSRPLSKENGVESITRQIHVSSGMHHDVRANSMNPSYYCNLIPKVSNEMVSNVARQPSANSKSPRPAVEGPILYNSDSGTSVERCGRHSDIHLFPSEIDDASILRYSSGHFQSGVGINSVGTRLHEEALLRSASRACGLVDVNQASKVCEERQSISPNKMSVFSRLKPALDADDEFTLKDPLKNIDDLVNEVMETLKGHYCQLVRKSNSPLKQVCHGNMSKFVKPQTLQSEAAKYLPAASMETVFDVSPSNAKYEAQTKAEIDVSPSNAKYETQTGAEINREIRILNFKRRSEVKRTCSAAEGVVLAEKQSKRRKLVRPSSFSEKMSDKGIVDKISENVLLSSQPSFNENDKEENPLEVLASSVGGESSNTQSRSSNLADGNAADITTGSESEKYDLGSAINKENSEGAELCLALSANDKKDVYTKLKNKSLGLPPKGVLDHVKGIFNKNVKDELQLSLSMKGGEMAEPLVMLKGDHKKPGITVCSDLNAEVKNEYDGDEGVSTKMELGGALNVAAAEVDGHEQQYDRISASGQVQYFEFLTK